MKFRSNLLRAALFVLLSVIGANAAEAQGVKRVVIVKVDGLPGYYVDKFVRQTDPKTGKSVLPWFDEIFYRNGTSVPNFYTRGMSLSGPSWGQLDTGQHLQIKGNVEYDRLTLRAYDYLNFFPYYVGYGMSKKADMPATEVMDQLGIPLMCDVFPFEKRYTSQQLYQRGNDWAVLAGGFLNLYPGSTADLIDEWTMGIEFRKVTIDQNERNILGKLIKRPDIDYFDYYDVSFDHVSHHNNDADSRVLALKDLDRLIGRIWEANKASSRADETALIVISDHGFNSEEKVYSQGFNLVKMLASAPGGGHHVITKRRLMLDYSIKGLYPLVPLITTTSSDSYYLKGESSKYPTALVDFDGNERSSLQLRNSDLNVLHILLQQLQAGVVSGDLKAAATDAVFDIVNKHRKQWKDTADGLTAELDALHRWRLVEERRIAALPPLTKEKSGLGFAEERQRQKALADIAEQNEKDYRKYVATLRNLLDLKQEYFKPRNIDIGSLITPGAMGDSNTLYELQNYVVGTGREGLVLGADHKLDLDRSFARVNYFELLHDQKVRNNVQKSLSNRPIDFVAVRVPAAVVSEALPDVNFSEDPIWLFGGDDKQALLLSRVGADGSESYRYLPVAELRSDAEGKITFTAQGWADGFPLRYFEDDNFSISSAGRAAWLSEWHTEAEWMNAVHKTKYSNGIIGLNEQLDRHPLFADDGNAGLAPDEILIRRFRQRQRQIAEADLLILANDHWNFDVRGFNPGGNHGSFFRVSTNSTFMIAGGARTGIPRGLAVEQPYDGMSFMPTVLRLMGKIDNANHPIAGLQEKGFRRFPGRVITEITGTGK